MQRKVLMAMAVGVVVLGLSFVNVRVANSTDVSVATGTVGATATVLGSTMSVKAKNVSDNAVAAGLAFGSVSGSTTYAIPSQYMEISYSSNAPSWALEVYTNNTGWTGPGSEVNRGGLLGTTNRDRRALLLWRVFDNTQSTHPVLSQSEVDAGNWTWVTDINDPTANTQDRRDYREVLTGNSTHTWFHGKPAGRYGETSSVSPVVVYLGADFSGVPADNYSTTLIFDFHHR